MNAAASGPQPGRGAALPPLLQNLTLFGRLLRGIGLPVSTARMLDLAQALPLIEVFRREEFHAAARALLIHRREDLELFDAAFALFWETPPERWTRTRLPGMMLRKQRSPVRQATFRPVAPGTDAGPDQQPHHPFARRTWSDRESLEHRDFSDLDEDELREVRSLIRDAGWKAARRRVVRFRLGGNRNLDLRRTLRMGLRSGGEWVRLERRRRREKPRPLIVLADVSGSMEQTARVLLHFLYGLSHGSPGRVEAFVFATRLTRITRKLADRRVDRALREASEAVRDWSGGTRIGEALHRFNLEWARRLPTSAAVVLLVSDGWDRGDPALVASEMERLRGLAWRVVWLNPLLSDEGYEPLTRGMVAALPHIHDFLPVNNLASVRSLAEHLAQLDPVGRSAAPRLRTWQRALAAVPPPAAR
ncbi:MAG: VWA domain-containing protein [Acidobacteriota bacterium]|nr:VWA domain-containing protein [Acidobacteriota bacterium]